MNQCADQNSSLLSRWHQVNRQHSLYMIHHWAATKPKDPVIHVEINNAKGRTLVLFPGNAVIPYVDRLWRHSASTGSALGSPSLKTDSISSFIVPSTGMDTVRHAGAPGAIDPTCNSGYASGRGSPDRFAPQPHRF